MATTPRRRRASTDFRKTERYGRAARELGLAVRAVRERCGLTLEEAAGRMEGDFRHLQRIEAGKANVTLATMLRLEEALDIELLRLAVALEAARDEPDPVVGGLSHARKNNIDVALAQAQASPHVLNPPELPDDRDDSVILSDLAAAIREQRKRLGMTQQLAHAAGVTLQHLQRIEYGRQNPTLLLLARLGRALNLSLALLVTKSDSRR